MAFSSFAPWQESKWAYAAMMIASNEAIADSGATQIFVMDGIPVHNKQKTMCPLKVALADGRRVMSTHMCDIIILRLPTRSCQLPPYSESVSSQQRDARLNLTSRNASLNTMEIFFNGHEGPDDSMDPPYRWICRQDLPDRYP